jgi:hypothetical protein
VLLKPVAGVLRNWNKPGGRFDIAMTYRDLPRPPAAAAVAAAAAAVTNFAADVGNPDAAKAIAAAAAAAEPSVSPALRFVPGSRLLRAAKFLDAVRTPNPKPYIQSLRAFN